MREARVWYPVDARQGSAAMRNTDVDAVVGLDPAFDTRDHMSMIRGLPFYDVEHVRMPLLHMCQDEADST